jgi:hypothetical protein
MHFSLKGALRPTLLLATILSCAAAVAASITISSPLSGQHVASPFTVSASSSGASLMQIYLDGVKVYQTSGSGIATGISATSGTHRLTVQAYSGSSIVKNTIYVTVGAGGALAPAPAPAPLAAPAPVASSGSATYPHIERMAGWANCDACAGKNGTGPAAPHAMAQGISSPSTTGSSVQFWLGGAVPYSAALWWKQLGARPDTSHFVYDLWFYLKNPGASQALEFDTNQTINGRQFVFGTECNYKGNHTWDVWDETTHWVSTGIACNVPTAYTWHHLTWEFERAGSQTHFIALTLDGAKHYVNQYHTPRIKSNAELNVAFQMDGDYRMTNYDVWLDNISLTAW